MFRFFPKDTSQMNANTLDSYLSEIKLLLKSQTQLSFLKLENHIYSNIVQSDNPIHLDFPKSHECQFNRHYLSHTKNEIEYFYRFLRIDEFPNMSTLNMLEDFVSFFIQATQFDPIESKNYLDLKRRQFKSSLNQKIRDIEGERAYEEIELALENIITKEIPLFKVECYIILCEKTLSDLIQSTSNATKTLTRLGMKCHIENQAQPYIVESIHQFPKKLLVSTPMSLDNLINYLPLECDELHSKGLSLIGEFANPCYFDLFNPESLNFNAIVVGPPGSGKSFLVGNLLKDHLENQQSALIIDRGGSYKRLIQYYDGVIINGAINPIVSKDPRFLSELIFSQMSEKDLTKQKRGEIYQKIKNLCPNRFDNLSQLLDELDCEEITFNFAETIDYLFTSQKISHSKIYYIDLEDYSTSILPTLLLVLIELFNQLEGPKILTLDECHFLLKNSADFIETRFRELRKKQGSAIAITQSFDDFTQSSLGLTITKCAFYKIFFKSEQSQNEFLDHFDLFKINSLSSIKGQYSSFYLKSDHHHKNCYLIPDKLTHALLTTNFNESKFINDTLKDTDLNISFKQQFESLFGEQHA